MRKLLLLLVCLFTLIGCAEEQDPYKIDSAATIKAPWKVGANVADIATGPRDAPKLSYIYRRFLGITVNGHFLVQEFYEEGQKYTDPYLMIRKENIDSIGAFKGVKGLIRSYYRSGQKLSEGFVKNDWWDGAATMWYEDGKKQSESYHQNRKMVHFTEWYPNGQMKADVSYKDGKAPQITKWDEQGNIIKK